MPKWNGTRPVTGKALGQDTGYLLAPAALAAGRSQGLELQGPEPPPYNIGPLCL